MPDTTNITEARGDGSPEVPVVRQSVAHSALLSLAGQFVPLLAAVVTMPYLARHLGHDRLGLLSILWTILGYASVLDLGMSLAVTRAVSRAQAGRQVERVPGIFWTAVVSQLLMGSVGAVMLALAAPFVASSLLNIPKPLASEAFLALLACAAGVPLLLISSSVAGLLQGMRRFDLTTRVQIPVTVSQYVLTALCSAWWPSVFLGVGILVAARGVGTALLYRSALKLLPRLRTSMRFDAMEFVALFRFGGWLTVSSVIGPLQVYADRFIIGGLLTLSAVAYYAVPLDASMRLLLIPAGLMTAVFPALSAAGPSDAQRVAVLASHSVRCVFAALGVPVALAMVFADDLLRAWLGEAFATNSAPILRILLVGILANALARVPLAVLNAAGRSDVTAKLQLMELPFQASALLVLLRTHGLPGAALAWTLRLVIETALLFVLAKRIVGLRLDRVLDVRLPVGLGALAAIGVSAGFLLQTVASPLARAALGIALFSTGLGATWHWYLTEGDKSSVLRGFARVRPQ